MILADQFGCFSGTGSLCDTEGGILVSRDRADRAVLSSALYGILIK